MSHLLIQGDARRIPLADGSVHCVVTSPPYFGLRDYGVAGQIGLEPTPDDFVASLVGVFREVRRVLRDDGTCWLNLGDSYASQGGTGVQGKHGQRASRTHTQRQLLSCAGISTLKNKDLVGIPWRVALALRDDGWYLRSDIIWHKPSPMPESVTDRPTKAHEYLFLLTKSESYYYDATAIREPQTGGTHSRGKGVTPKSVERTNGDRIKANTSFHAATAMWRESEDLCRNKRSVWTVASSPFSGAHFATFPPKLIEPCILAGTSEKGCCPACGSPWTRSTERTQLKRERPNDYIKRTGESGTCNSCSNSVAGVAVKTTGWAASCDCPAAEPVPCVVFDPFGGAMTSVVVAEGLGRIGIATELSREYLGIGKRRLDRPHAAPLPVSQSTEDLPLFTNTLLTP